MTPGTLSRPASRAMTLLSAIWQRIRQGAAAVEGSRRLRLGLMLILAVYAFAGTASQLRKPDVTGDEGSYIALAFNLYKLGVITHGQEVTGEAGVEPYVTEDGVVTWPSASRAPAYLLFLATSLHLHPDAGAVDRDCMIDRPPSSLCREVRQDLKLGNVLLFTLLTLLTYAVTRQLSGSAVAGFFAALLVASSESLAYMADTLRSEVLAAFLFCLASSALLWAWQRPGLLRCGFVGICFGALALCQPIYLYAIIPLSVVLAIRLARFRSIALKPGMAAACFGVSLVAFSLTVGPWLLRNHHYFGTYNVTGTGAATLRIRAEYDQMTWREYIASFAYWAGDGRERIAGTFFPEDWYHRLDRDNSATGYYRIAKGRGAQLFRETGLAGRELKEALGQEAKSMIFADPVKHVLVSIPFAWRGLYAESGLSIHPRPMKLSGLMTRLIQNPLYWIAAVFCIVHGLRRRDYRYLVFATLVFWGWASYAGGSHYIPRYSYPFIPILATLTVTAISILLSRKSAQAPHGAD